MTNSPLVQLVTTPTVTRAGAGPSQCTHQECQAQGLQSLVLLSSLLLICTGTASFTSLFLYLLCRKMKTLKATMLVLLLGLFSFGVYHVGGLGTLTWSTTGELGELSETLSLPVQLRKLQEQLYHLRWSAKDVAELALQEGVKQAKLPGFTGQIRARGRRIYSGVLSSLQHAVQEIINQALEKLEEIQALMPDYALKSAGAMTLCIQTSSKALPVQIDKMGIGTCRGTGEKGREVKGQFVPLAEPVIGQTPWEAQKGCFTVLSFAMAKYDNLMSPRNVFQRGRATKVFLYSLPVMDYMRSPELILEPENHPGNCWPFPGSKDHVFIKLPVPVNPRAITMDHGSGTAFYGESISGPPKDFALYGFKEEHEEQGQFTFLAALNPSQTFQLKTCKAIEGPHNELLLLQEQLKEKQRHCVVTDDFHKRKSADIPKATSALLCPFCSARSFCNMSDALGTDLLDCCYSIPDPQLVWRIMSQLEFYLSGENLAKDAFLLKHVQKNKMGFLSIKLLTSFKKISPQCSVAFPTTVHVFQENHLLHRYKEEEEQKPVVLTRPVSPVVSDDEMDKSLDHPALPLSPGSMKAQELFPEAVYEEIGYSPVWEKQKRFGRSGSSSEQSLSEQSLTQLQLYPGHHEEEHGLRSAPDVIVLPGDDPADGYDDAREVSDPREDVAPRQGAWEMPRVPEEEAGPRDAPRGGSLCSQRNAEVPGAEGDTSSLTLESMGYDDVEEDSLAHPHEDRAATELGAQQSLSPRPGEPIPVVQLGAARREERSPSYSFPQILPGPSWSHSAVTMTELPCQGEHLSHLLVLSACARLWTGLCLPSPTSMGHQTPQEQEVGSSVTSAGLVSDLSISRFPALLKPVVMVEGKGLRDMGMALSAFIELLGCILVMSLWCISEAVQEIITQALDKLEEMQVPMPDYALKSAGAVTLYIQTSSKALRVQIGKMGIGTCPGPENHPGNCWPFPGSQGHVFIKLSMPVIPRAVTMDHVSGTAFRGESISGAPKDFAVYGFKEEHEEQGVFLGQFTFLAALNPSPSDLPAEEHTDDNAPVPKNSPETVGGIAPGKTHILGHECRSAGTGDGPYASVGGTCGGQTEELPGGLHKQS
ncbi:hypothetical protein Q9966_013892 [Columba livia]|nr:hypothetical protein Q9966_013892 [Columba livia]